MINTLDKFRTEMDGSRVPKYEVAFLEKKKVIQEKQRRDMRRQERRDRKEKKAAEIRENEAVYSGL